LNAVTANYRIIFLNKTWPINNSLIKNQIPKAEGGSSKGIHSILLRFSSDDVMYGRLDVITDSDKQTDKVWSTRSLLGGLGLLISIRVENLACEQDEQLERRRGEP
jgi:hypothetical protein